MDPALYNLTSYANSNFAKDHANRNLVIKYSFFLNRAMVLWRSKKQRIVFNSINKTKYITLRHAAKKAV